MAAAASGGGWRELEAAERGRCQRAEEERITEAVWAPLETVLGAVPEGGTVALVTLLGSLCPVTRGHVQCFEEARRLLLGGGSPAGSFDCVVGLFALNLDSYVQQKLGPDEAIRYDDRRRLIELATAAHPWLGFSPRATSPKLEAGKLAERWPKLRVSLFVINGADDVLRFRKWEQASPQQRMITMLRPGSTEPLVAALAAAGVPASGTADFVVGPELPEVSSTQAREALARRDRDSLLKVLHPAVADWLLARADRVGVPGPAAQKRPHPDAALQAKRLGRALPESEGGKRRRVDCMDRGPPGSRGDHR